MGLEVIGDVCGYENSDEGKEVGRCGEGLCGEWVVIYVFEYCGEEDGERGVSYVGEEEYRCSDLSNWVCKNGEDFVDFEFR